ncbi:hypothetical protein AGMMS49546_39550 [Spirochaetia bacterium]|nr:hypothetical protein AGMMS49546_39550 [Spirochaetia bacterium]
MQKGGAYDSKGTSGSYPPGGLPLQDQAQGLIAMDADQFLVYRVDHKVHAFKGDCTEKYLPGAGVFYGSGGVLQKESCRVIAFL